MQAVLLGVCLTATSAVLAEVSDKMPSITDISIYGFLAATAIFLIARFRWWFGYLGFLAALFFFYGTIDLLRDSAMRESLLQEQGVRYFLTLVASDFSMVCAAFLGMSEGWRKRKARLSNELACRQKGKPVG